MILDPHGRPVRRSLGFVRELVYERDKAGDIGVTACGFSIPCEEYAASEECSGTTVPLCVDVVAAGS
jgi:hypothetical protein